MYIKFYLHYSIKRVNIPVFPHTESDYHIGVIDNLVETIMNRPILV